MLLTVSEAWHNRMPFAWGLVILGLIVASLAPITGAVGQPQVCPFPEGSPEALLFCTGGYLNTPTPTDTAAAATQTLTSTVTAAAFTNTPTATRTVTPAICPYPDGSPEALITCTGGLLNTPTARPVATSSPTATTTATTTATATPQPTASATATPMGYPCRYTPGSYWARLLCSNGIEVTPTVPPTATRGPTVTPSPTSALSWTPPLQVGLDASYGTNGVAWVYSGDHVGGADIQGDGKVVVMSQRGSEVRFTRWDATGQLDATFGTDGVLSYTVPMTDQVDLTAVHLALSPTGQLAFTAVRSTTYTYSNVFLMLGRTSIIRLEANGLPSSDFGVNGEAFVQGLPTLTNFETDSLVRLPDGGYLFKHGLVADIVTPAGWLDEASTALYHTNSQCCKDGRFHRLGDGRALWPQNLFDADVNGQIARLNSDGSLDTTYGVAGRAVASSASLVDVADDSFRRAYVLADPSVFRTMQVVRLDSSGQLDLNWGATGVLSVTAAFDSLSSLPPFLYVDDEDRPVLIDVGEDRHGLQVIRLDPKGSVDTRYGPGGLQTLTIGTGGQVIVLLNMLKQPDGRWLAVTLSQVNGFPIVALASLDSDPPAATATPIPPTATSTLTPSRTPTPSRTLTPTKTPSTTGTSSPTASSTHTASPTASVTLAHTATPTATETYTPAPTTTSVPSRTTAPTAIPSRTAWMTPTSSPSSTAAPAMTVTPTPSGQLRIDPGFGPGGHLTVGGPLSVSQTICVRTASDGHLLALVQGQDASDIVRYVLTRYTSSGVLDVSFGGKGSITIDEPTLAGLELTDLVIERDGSVIVVGTAMVTPAGRSSVQEVIIALRRNATGSRDASFGVEGVAMIAVGDVARGDTLALTPQGVIIAGHAWSGEWESHRAVLARLNSAGALDPTFGVNGIVVDPAVSIEAVWPVSGGRFLVDGVAEDGGSVWRRLADGEWDVSFGTGGGVVVDSPSQDALVAFAPNGRFFAVKESRENGNRLVTVKAFDADGQPHAAWGHNGHMAFAVGDSHLLISARVIADGALLVLVGPGPVYPTAFEARSSAETTRLYRIAADGTQDVNFGTGGVIDLPMGWATDLLTQPDGSVLIVNEGDVMRLAPAPVQYRLSLPQLQCP